MKLHSIQVKPGATKPRKRLGRGNGSGHGTFSGRGVKGQGQHASGSVTRPGFEGGQTPLIMRLPKLRGFRSPNRVSYQALNVSALEVFKDGDEVNVTTLAEKNLVRSKQLPVKILGDGKITKKLTLKVPAISRIARDKVVRAGGKVL